MKSLVNPASLGATVDAVNDAFFWKGKLSQSERSEAAQWIAGRCGEWGAYVPGFPAPTERDFREGLRFFTGERFRTRAGTAHSLGEEACRALILLNSRRKDVSEALKNASESMAARLRESVGKGYARPRTGHYCCGRCSVALWRHVTAGASASLKARSV